MSGLSVVIPLLAFACIVAVSFAVAEARGPYDPRPRNTLADRVAFLFTALTLITAMILALNWHAIQSQFPGLRDAQWEWDEQQRERQPQAPTWREPDRS